jgi:hypothetical protein
MCPDLSRAEHHVATGRRSAAHSSVAQLHQNALVPDELGGGKGVEMRGGRPTLEPGATIYYTRM